MLVLSRPRDPLGKLSLFLSRNPAQSYSTCAVQTHTKDRIQEEGGRGGEEGKKCGRGRGEGREE